MLLFIAGNGNAGGIVGNSANPNVIPSFKLGINGQQWDAGLLAMNNLGATTEELEKQLKDYDPFIPGVSRHRQYASRNLYIYHMD